MSWPVSQDYNEAVQNPGLCFGDPDLRAAEPVTNALGLPVPCSGSFADVYHLSHPASGVSWAVKCFTRPVPGRQERYHEISRHLRRARFPFTVEFTYLAEGIRVRGQWYPVVKMEWVEGLLLNQFVRDNLGRPALLDALTNLWGRMARRLREADVAHGDLQHGNVLLVPGSKTTSLALKLIDYDGMYVPALAGKPAGEVGHPAYQHPQRIREATAGVEVDRVPLLVVAAALRCLAVAGPRLWKRYDTGDNLLFRQADLKAPEESPLFHELWRLDDELAHVLVGRLALACHDPIEQAPPVTEFLAEDLLPVLSAAQQARAEDLLGSPAKSVPVAGIPPDARRFDFEGPGPVRLRRPPARSGVPVVWVCVALLVAAIVVAVPIVWLMASSDSGSAPPQTASKDRKKSGASPHTKQPHATSPEPEPAPDDRDPAPP